MSCGGKPMEVKRLYARRAMAILRSYVVACPSSSKAITTTAAPKRLNSRALPRKSCSPALRLMELTMHLPCAFFSPARTVCQSLLSIIRTALPTAGSPLMCRQKVCISSWLSSMASSMLISMTVAPPSIWFRATESASPYCFSAMRRANLREPATFVRSPTFVKFCVSRSMSNGSRPETRSLLSAAGMVLGLMSRNASAIALMCCSSVPQQPPAILMSPASAILRRCEAVKSGSSSYSPIWLGNPAFG